MSDIQPAEVAEMLERHSDEAYAVVCRICDGYDLWNAVLYSAMWRAMDACCSTECGLATVIGMAEDVASDLEELDREDEEEVCLN